MLNCAAWGSEKMSTIDFFRGLVDPQRGKRMLKLKDFPPDETFSEAFPRHNTVRMRL